MTIEERTRVISALNSLAEILDTSLTPARIAGYLLALDDIGADDLVAAVGTAARSCVFFPKPVELRDFARQVDSRRRIAAEEALREVAVGREQQQLEARHEDLAERERTFNERMRQEREAWEAGQPARDKAFAEFQKTMREVLRFKTIPDSKNHRRVRHV